MPASRSQALLFAVSLWIVWAYAALHFSVPELQNILFYSTGYFVLLIGYAAVAAILTLLIALPAFPWDGVLRRLAERRMWVSAAGLLVGTLVWLALPFKDQAKLFPTVLILGVVWQAWQGQTVHPVWARRALWIALALLGLGLVVQVAMLLYAPEIHTHDEGAYAHIAQTYLRTGMLSGDLYGYPPRHFIGFGSWLVALAAWLKTFGFGWLSARGFAFFASLLAIPLVGLAARKWYGGRAAVYAMVCFGLLAGFVETHRVRPDSATVLLVSAALAALSYALHEGRARYYALTGFFATLAFEAHLVTLAHWGAYVALLGIAWVVDMIRGRALSFPFGLFWFGVGAFIPALIFAASHLLPDLGKPFAIQVAPQGRQVLDMFAREIVRWRDYLSTYPLDALIVLLGLLAALRRRRSAGAPLLLLGLLIPLYVVVAPTVYPQYTLYFLPLFALIAGLLLARLQPILPLLLIAFLGLRLAGAAGGVLTSVPPEALLHRPVPPVVRFVSENFPPGSRVAMNMFYYLYFDSGDRYAYLNPGIHPPTIERMGGAPEDEVWASFDLDAVVFNSLMDEWTPWLEAYLNEAGFVAFEGYQEAYLTIYLPPDSPLLTP